MSPYFITIIFILTLGAIDQNIIDGAVIKSLSFKNVKGLSQVKAPRKLKKKLVSTSTEYQLYRYKLGPSARHTASSSSSTSHRQKREIKEFEKIGERIKGERVKKKVNELIKRFLHDMEDSKKLMKNLLPSTTKIGTIKIKSSPSTSTFQNGTQTEEEYACLLLEVPEGILPKGIHFSEADYPDYAVAMDGMRPVNNVELEESDSALYSINNKGSAQRDSLNFRELGRKPEANRNSFNHGEMTRLSQKESWADKYPRQKLAGPTVDQQPEGIRQNTYVENQIGTDNIPSFILRENQGDSVGNRLQQIAPYKREQPFMFPEVPARESAKNYNSPRNVENSEGSPSIPQANRVEKFDTPDYVVDEGFRLHKEPKSYEVNPLDSNLYDYSNHARQSENDMRQRSHDISQQLRQPQKPPPPQISLRRRIRSQQLPPPPQSPAELNPYSKNSLSRLNKNLEPNQGAIWISLPSSIDLDNSHALQKQLSKLMNNIKTNRNQALLIIPVAKGTSSPPL